MLSERVEADLSARVSCGPTRIRVTGRAVRSSVRRPTVLRALATGLLATALLRPYDPKGGRGKGRASGWRYKCPVCKEEYVLDAPRSNAVCPLDGATLKPVK